MKLFVSPDLARRVIRKGNKMALSISGIFSRIWKPRLCGPICHIPQTGTQTRGYAARKMTREKALKKKRAYKLKIAALEARKTSMGIKIKGDVEKRTIISTLPPPPTNFNVYFRRHYKCPEYSLLEAIKLHKEDLDPSVLNQPGASVTTVVEIDMTGEKQTRVVKAWSQVIVYPYPFFMGMRKRVLVLCPEADKQSALEAGADFAGGPNLMKDIKKGTFDLGGFDVVIGSLALHDEINLIRAHLKLLHPKISNGTLTDDIVGTIKKVKFGFQYSVNMSHLEDKFGWVKCDIGKLDMPPENVERNFESLLGSIESRRPRREGDFVQHAYTICNPSREKIKINISPFMQKLRELSAERERERAAARQKGRLAVEEKEKSESTAAAGN